MSGETLVASGKGGGNNKGDSSGRVAHRVHRPQGKQARVADLLNLGRSWGGGIPTVGHLGSKPNWPGPSLEPRRGGIPVVVGSNPTASACRDKH